MHIHLRLIEKDTLVFLYERSVIDLFEPRFEKDVCPNQDGRMNLNDADVVKMLYSEPGC